MYDIIIIGGGPAGATLARLAGKHMKVLVIEKRGFREPLYGGIQKCCGGLLDPDAQKSLASFGLGLPRSVMVSPQMFSVRAMDMDHGLERHYQRHYINIDREAFDKWQLSLAGNSSEISLDSVFHSLAVSDDHVEVTFFREGKVFREKAAFVVGADGASSRVRKTVFPMEKKPPEYIAIQEWFETSSIVNYYGAIFCKEVTDFYSWVIPKDNMIIVGSALNPGRDATRKFGTLKQKLRDNGFDLGTSMRKNGSLLFRPGKTGQILTGKERVFLIGEAAGWISPSSAEGMSYAFKSALALHKAFRDGGDVPGNYRKHTATLRKNVIIKNMKSPFMYNGLLRQIIMKSNLLSIHMNREE
ncbi:MAG: FAD-binding protein [Clostridia bacterium]